MTKTNTRVGFKTRYCIQAIDRLTALPASEEIHFLGTSGSSELSDDFCTIEIHGQPFDATKAAAKYAIVSEFSTIGAEESSFFTLSDSSPSVLALNWTGAGA